MKKLIILLLTVLTIWSCSQKTTFLPSSEMPTAQGHVKIRKDYNSDYDVSSHRDQPDQRSNAQPCEKKLRALGGVSRR